MGMNLLNHFIAFIFLIQKWFHYHQGPEEQIIKLRPVVDKGLLLTFVLSSIQRG